jgi:hypothetical protein
MTLDQPLRREDDNAGEAEETFRGARSFVLLNLEIRSVASGRRRSVHDCSANTVADSNGFLGWVVFQVGEVESVEVGVG